MSSLPTSYRILVGSYTDSIYTLEFKPHTEDSAASLRLTARLPVGHRPSWLTRHPSNLSTVYTGLEQDDGRLLALHFELETGEGRVLAEESSGGRDPCTIAATDAEVFVGNYSSGTLGIYGLNSVEPKILQSLLQFHGTGPDESRQEASHPHQVYLHSSAEEVLVPDLGADKTWRLTRNSEGKWEKTGEVDYVGLEGGGPRHIGVYDGVLYTVLELSNKLAAHVLPPLFPSSTPAQLIASASTLRTPPENAPRTPMLAAELLIPPPNSTFPDPLVYISNRNDPHPQGDTIAIFSTVSATLPQTQTLRLLSETRTGLNHLRGFLFFGPHDRYIVAGGANAGGVKVFERVEGGRALKEVVHLSTDSSDLSPTSFLVL